MKAPRVFKAGTADFADCLMERGASSAGCSRTMTFDVAAAKTADMTLIQCPLRAGAAHCSPHRGAGAAASHVPRSPTTA